MYAEKIIGSSELLYGSWSCMGCDDVKNEYPVGINNWSYNIGYDRKTRGGLCFVGCKRHITANN